MTSQSHMTYIRGYLDAHGLIGCPVHCERDHNEGKLAILITVMGVNHCIIFAQEDPEPGDEDLDNCLDDFIKAIQSSKFDQHEGTA